MPVPEWFRERVTSLKAVGFLGNVELSDDDLEFQWKRFDGEKRPDILAYMLARNLRRAYEMPDQVLHPHVAMKLILDGLVEVAGGRFVIGDVKERWDGTRLYALELSTPSGRWELTLVGQPTEDSKFPTLDNRALLAGLNAIADGGAFCRVKKRAMFVDARERAALEAAEVKVLDIAPDTTLVKRIDGQALKKIVKPTVLSEIAPREDAAEASAIRQAFRPILRVDGTGVHEGNPRCDHCGGPMALLVQHALGALPIGLKRSGPLQLFACAGSDANGCFIEHRGLAIRLPAETPAIARYAITDWEPFEDQPGAWDWGTAGLDEEVAEQEGLEAEDQWKCGGWPAWQQEREIECKRCGKDATLVLQIPSHEEFPFADGVVFVLVCDHAPCTWAGTVLQYS